MKHRIILAINTSDKLIQQRTVDSITRLRDYFGQDTVIEIVAYGPGLNLLMESNPHYNILQKLSALNHVTLSACANSIKKIEQQTGTKLQLMDSAQIVVGGLIRIVELQEKNFAYLQP